MNYLSNIKKLIKNNIVLKKKYKLIEDNSTLMTYFEIGIILCKENNEIVIKYITDEKIFFSIYKLK